MAPARTQERQGGRTVGLITAAEPQQYEPNLKGLKKGFEDLGYVEGKTLRLEVRYADGRIDRIAGLASELSALRVDVLITGGSHVTRVARKIAGDIPMVMAWAGDPVGGGLVQSLSRPGGRITGLTTLSPQLAGKRLELLKETLPALQDVAAIWNPDVPERVIQFKETQAAAAKLRLRLHSFEARNVDEIDSAVRSAANSRVHA